MNVENARIVLVDSDRAQKQSWDELFELLGYHFNSFTNGTDALESGITIYRCDVLIADQYLSDMNGVDLIKRAKTINPALHSMLLTESSDLNLIRAVALVQRCELVEKPVHFAEIESSIQAIRKA